MTQHINKGLATVRTGWRASALRLVLVLAMTTVTVAALALNLAVAAPTAAAAQLAPATVDLPPCEASAPGSDAGLSLGIVQPYASEHLVAYAARLTLADPALNVCAEPWSAVLPRWVPWSPALERGLGWGVFVLAFVAAVSLLWATTPRTWWQRTTLLGLLGVGGLTWVLAVAALFALQALGAQRLLYGTAVSVRVPKQAGVEWLNLAGARELEAWLAARSLLPALAAAKAPSQGAPAANPTPAEPLAATQANGVAPAGPYRVAHRLNLRSGPGTQHAWQTTLPRGEVVQFDGATQGDWWRMRRADGAVGWCSSLWLRRPGEGLPAAEASGATPRS